MKFFTCILIEGFLQVFVYLRNFPYIKVTFFGLFENSYFEKTWFREQKHQRFLATKIVLLPGEIYVMQSIRSTS